jgi:AcrR family transcriptional regulator
MAAKPHDAEQKIKEAARKIFQEKGFAATKTRDIAEAAGINLALLNYYFRSKQKLYNIIMTESIQFFFGNLVSILNDEKTTIRQKLDLFVEKEISIISQNPDIPLFVINEARTNPEEFAKMLKLKEKLNKSKFVEQFQHEMMMGKLPKINPIHLALNLSSLIVFPFIANPLFQATIKYSKKDFTQILEERKRLIPLWIDAMLKVE